MIDFVRPNDGGLSSAGDLDAIVRAALDLVAVPVVAGYLRVAPLMIARFRETPALMTAEQRFRLAGWLDFTHDRTSDSGEQRLIDALRAFVTPGASR